MENLALIVSLLIIVSLGILIYLLIQLIKRLSESDPPARDKRPPKIFVRGLFFNENEDRWQLACSDPSNIDNQVSNDEILKGVQGQNPPEIDRCSSGPNELAPELTVRAKDKIVFDFSRVPTDSFLWAEFQFPEPDLFEEQRLGKPDRWIFRVQPGSALTLTVNERECPECDAGGRGVSVFVFAIHVVDCSNTDAVTARTGYVQGGSPPRIKLEHG